MRFYSKHKTNEVISKVLRCDLKNNNFVQLTKWCTDQEQEIMFGYFVGQMFRMGQGGIDASFAIRMLRERLLIIKPKVLEIIAETKLQNEKTILEWNKFVESKSRELSL